jgi:copper chaperone CopZ
MAETTLRLKTTGMHCGSCAMMVKMALEDLPGVVAAGSEYASGMTEVTFDSDLLSQEQIIGAIEAAGYGAEAV